MELGFVEDFTSTVQLDADLFALPSSGLYLNSGVHQSITIDNLLQFLPKVDFQLNAWAVGITYGAYLPDRNRNNLVTDGDFVYESLQDGNLGNALTDTAWWRKTNFESIHLKNMIQSVKDMVNADLNLTKRLVNNQYVYQEGDTVVTLPADYAAWVFEPKGSDYVSFRINQMAIQAMTAPDIDVFVVNQGQLVTTLTVPVSNGVLSFEQVNYTFTGKGKWYFIINSQSVKVKSGWNDPLKYTGFTMCPVTGTGSSPETATWSYNSNGNGMGFNITTFLDASQYITNNINEFANYIRACFELTAFEMMKSNSKNRSNREQRIQMDERELLFQTTDLQSNTVAKRYYDEKKKAFRQIEKTFDTQLSTGYNSTSLDIQVGWQ